MCKNLTIIYDVSPVDKRQGFANIVIGDENSDPSIGQVPNEFLDIAHRNGINAGKRFIQKYERGVGRKRSCNFATAAFAA